MAWQIEVIFDDRCPPPPEIETIIGRTPFSGVIKRRRRLIDLLREQVAQAKPAALHLLSTETDRDRVVTRIENGPATGVAYLRLPTTLGPMDLSRLADVTDKCRFAMETTLVGPVFENEAVALLTRNDALAVLAAAGDEARRDVFLGIAERASMMQNHLRLVDLRRAPEFLQFITGSTEARHFNALRIHKGVLTKSSADKAKMRGEYAFFHAVPEAMKRFLIPTFDFVEEDGGARYSMEHLVVPDLALQVTHQALSPDNFATVIALFFRFAEARARRKVGTEAVRAAGREAYLGKMRRRLDELMATDEGSRLDAILSAAGPLGGIREMEARAAALIEAALCRDRSDALAVSHGDPCFSNSLFDRRTALYRLIDPRGAETAAAAEMHPLYDVAKFSHSILGGYDFVNSGLFLCRLDAGMGLRLEFPHGSIPGEAQGAFEARLAEEGLDLWVVRAYELSLFMSMLPLHRDQPLKLVGFALIAAELIRSLEAGARKGYRLKAS